MDRDMSNPVPETHVRVRFRGQYYAITRKHASMLSKRRHLYRDPLGLYVEDHRCIEVIGEPIR